MPAAVQREKQDQPEPFQVLHWNTYKRLYIAMGNQCSLSRRGCAERPSVAGSGVPKERVLQQLSFEFSGEGDDRIRCTHEETVAAVVEPWEDMGSNKSLGWIFTEWETAVLWPAAPDWTNVSVQVEHEISSLTDSLWCDVLLDGMSHYKNDSKVPVRITRRGCCESHWRVIESAGKRWKVSKKTKWKREGFLFCQSALNRVEGFKEDENEKRRVSVLSVGVRFELIFGHPCFYVVCAWLSSLRVRVGHCGREERSATGAVYHPRKAGRIYRVVSRMISKRGVVYRTTERALVLSPVAHRTWGVTTDDSGDDL